MLYKYNETHSLNWRDRTKLKTYDKTDNLFSLSCGTKLIEKSSIRAKFTLTQGIINQIEQNHEQEYPLNLLIRSDPYKATAKINRFIFLFQISHMTVQ